MPLVPESIVSFFEILKEESVATLQRGMNFRFKSTYSVILMSVRKGAPYSDKVLDEGGTLIYEGHNIPNKKNGPDPKAVDQAGAYPSGKRTQNGWFYEAAQDFKLGKRKTPEFVKVYEKIKGGIWVFNGFFDLVDAWREESNGRKVFKFKLLLRDMGEMLVAADSVPLLEHTRIIPSLVKREVWKRDKGKCVLCGSSENMHYDHDLPYSKGGTSLEAQNILPMDNHTVDLDGPDHVRYWFDRRLHEKKGYTTLPLQTIDEVLLKLGIQDGGQLPAVGWKKLGQELDCDALIYGDLLEFTYQTTGFLNVRKVRARYKMVDARTGETLWEAEGVGAKSSTALSSEGALKMGALALGSQLAEKAMKSPLRTQIWDMVWNTIQYLPRAR